MSTTTTVVKSMVIREIDSEDVVYHGIGANTNFKDKDLRAVSPPCLPPIIEEQEHIVKPERQYSREMLIELFSHPLSKKKPACLESPLNKSIVSGRLCGRGVLWQDQGERRRSDSPPEEEKQESTNDSHKRRVGDPKERLRKEQDVVLSPQRRSFNSGCFVPIAHQQHSTSNRRSESPMTKGEGRELQHREIATRRIGSGRIMRDPMWEVRSIEKEGHLSGHSIENQEFNYRHRGDERYERRPFERRGDQGHEKEQTRNQGRERNGRFSTSGNDRKRTNSDNTRHEEEPEWFSGGPTSQHDTIELHGFEDAQDEKTGGNKKQTKNAKNNSRSNRKSSDTAQQSKLDQSSKKNNSRKSPQSNIRQSESPRSSPSKKTVADNFSEEPKEVSTSSESEFSSQPKTDVKLFPSETEFNIEDILNFDSLSGLLPMTNGCEEESSGSRFSQFFRRESPSPSPQVASNFSQENKSQPNDVFGSVVTDMSRTNILIPPDGGNTYFAPISPAATSAVDVLTKTSSSTLLDMLQKANKVQESSDVSMSGRKITKKPTLKDLEASGKVQSVEELEARLRQQQGIGKPTEVKNQLTKEEEVAAFKKLMMKKSHPVPQSSSRAEQIGQEQKNSVLPPGMVGQFQGQQNMTMNQQMSIPHDLVMKLLQVQQQQRQQEMFAKLLINSGTAPAGRLNPHSAASQFSVPPPVSPLSPEIQLLINNMQPTAELLQCPEAQALIRGLKRGDISLLNLIDQLKKGSATMQPMHRDVIASVIKLTQMQTGILPRDTATAPSLVQPSSASDQSLLHQMLFNQQQQQLRIPSPHNSMLQRVPSPRELAAHTQNILQNALLKKKLEEQRENYLKRQELQRSNSPNIAVSASGGGNGGVSPANQHTISPTPLAFTPTSVLRKMTADKESDSANKAVQSSDSSQKPSTGGKEQSQVPSAASFQQPVVNQQPMGLNPLKPTQVGISNNWNVLKPHQGRPIVKGGNSFQGGTPSVPAGLDYLGMTHFGPISRSKMQQPAPANPQQQNPFVLNVSRHAGQNITPNRVRNMQSHISNVQNQQRNGNPLQQILINQNYVPVNSGRSGSNLKQDSRMGMRTREGQGGSRSTTNYTLGTSSFPPQDTRDISNSPVSNQLARWFSPELLAQARAGKLPDMPPISPNQNMLSVEELERLQQAVHNELC